MSDEVTQVTAPLREAIAEAERMIRGADFIRTEQDLLEGLDYLSGRIRMAMQMAFDHDLDRPVLINSTHQYSRQGLDNPDAIYHSAYLVDHATYVLHGRRGTTADLSFQVMDGTYNADAAPGEGVAFDDRGFEVGDDGRYALVFAPAEGAGAVSTSAGSPARPREGVPVTEFRLPAGAKNLIVREVYSDWNAEERGSMWIERTDMRGVPRPAYDAGRMAQRYQVAAKLLIGSIKTWFLAINTPNSA